MLRSTHPSLLLKQVEGRFRDVAAERGLITSRGAHVATIFDVEGDGDLDIYIGYYGRGTFTRGEERRNIASRDGRNGTPNELWIFEGGRYVEKGAALGVDDPGWTLAAGAFDYDADGDLDLYLANDYGPNRLFRNDLSDTPGGRFVDQSDTSHTADAGSGMSVSVADVDGDGRWDLYVSNIDVHPWPDRVHWSPEAPDTPLWRERVGNRLFIGTSAKPGDGGTAAFEAVYGSWFPSSPVGWSWDADFFDADNDGDEDFYLTNGWITGSAAGNQPNRLFLRQGERFVAAAPSGPEAFEANSRSTAVVDVDRDGDLDLVVASYKERPRLLRNETSPKQRSLQVRLAGYPEPMAVGAVVEVRAKGEPQDAPRESRSQRRQVDCGRGYLSQAHPLLTFGLGSATKADVVVTWPNGRRDAFPGLSAGSIHELRYDTR